MHKEQERGAYRVGVIGTGRIANRFIPEADLIDDISMQGVYNPHWESAERFAARWGIKAYRNIEIFFQGVDLVYVASPHETHFAYIKAALEQGKHVLCEKPLVFKRDQAESLFVYAKKHKLVLFEGIKTAYCPGFRKLLEIAHSGAIGNIRYVDACFTKLESEDSRELTERIYGGSFTELGSYCLLPIIKLLGYSFEDVRFETIRGNNSLDVFTTASFRYPGGLATAVCGLGVKAEGRLMIAGTKGYIIAEAPWWKTVNIEVRYENPLEVEKYSEQFQGDGLRYEVRAFINQVNGGDCNSLKFGLTSEDSIALADLMGRFMEKERFIKMENRE